jgi:Tfp pilus assembly protein PilN
VITKLNLATYPFRNRTLPYVASAFVLVLAAVLGLYSLATLNSNRKQNELLAKAVTERQDEIQKLKGEGEKVQQLLTPDQKNLLMAAHKLVANKKFSWSRLFGDLENVLPTSVAASRITVQNIFEDNGQIKAELELGVLSKDFGSVQAMIESMNNSGLFKADLRGQDLQKNERLVYTEYTFHLIYTPSYGYPAATSNEVARNEGGMQ